MKAWVWFVLAISIGIASCSPNAEPASREDVSVTGIEHMVTIDAEGEYVPQTLTIAQGDTVTWVNEGNSRNWPATDAHPSHTVYPGSSIAKCGGDERTTIFDACTGLAQGESYSFTFMEKGTWPYHDHLRSSATGTIIVE